MRRREGGTRRRRSLTTFVTFGRHQAVQVDASGIEEGGGETMKLDLRECAAAAATAAGSSQGFKRKENETRV